jgi:nitroreductase
MAHAKDAHPDHAIHELLVERWSPYAFASQAVAADDLRALFEAARWAASSYNEQPWRYLVATRDEPAEFERMLSCLVEGNQPWAKAAPVLALGCVSQKLALNGQPNAAAEHDLGAASACLSVEATARGLVVHQMIGILPERARELYEIPPDFRPLTGLAIGYLGNSNDLPEKYRGRDLAPRRRRPQAEFVFAGRFGTPAAIGNE